MNVNKPLDFDNRTKITKEWGRKLEAERDFTLL